MPPRLGPGLEAEPRRGRAGGVEPSPDGLDSGRAAGGAGFRLGVKRLGLGGPTAGGSRSPRVGIRCTSRAEQESTLKGGGGVFLSLVKLNGPNKLVSGSTEPRASLDYGFLRPKEGLAPCLSGLHF